LRTKKPLPKVPGDAVLRLPDDFTDEDLIAALEKVRFELPAVNSR
jgi:hypothetical protein